MTPPTRKRDRISYNHLFKRRFVNALDRRARQNRMRDGGIDILEQDITYLDSLEEVMELGLTQEETTAEMIRRFPDKGGEVMLGISMRNLFRGK